MDEKELVHEPRFFLDKELIHYLKKNMKASVVIVNNSSTSHTIYTAVSIAGETICEQQTVWADPPKPVDQSVDILRRDMAYEISEMKKDIRDTVYHLQNMSMRVKQLEEELRLLKNE